MKEQGGAESAGAVIGGIGGGAESAAIMSENPCPKNTSASLSRPHHVVKVDVLLGWQLLFI